jgi:hypothetical protein
MAAYCLFMKDSHEFYNKLKSRDPDLVTKMVKNVLHAIKTKKKKTDLFEIHFKDMTNLVFTLEEDQYRIVLENCLDDMVKLEQYEICAQIRDTLNKPVKSKKKLEKSKD